jgi:hypothetical protein
LVVDHSAAIESKVYGEVYLAHIVEDRSKSQEAAAKQASKSSVAVLANALAHKAPVAPTTQLLGLIV